MPTHPPPHFCRYTKTGHCTYKKHTVLSTFPNFSSNSFHPYAGIGVVKCTGCIPEHWSPDALGHLFGRAACTKASRSSHDLHPPCRSRAILALTYTYPYLGSTRCWARHSGKTGMRLLVTSHWQHGEPIGNEHARRFNINALKSSAEPPRRVCLRYTDLWRAVFSHIALFSPLLPSWTPVRAYWMSHSRRRPGQA